MKMNKYASALLTLALTASMGTTVFAAEITTPGGAANADIKAAYSAIIPDPETIYSVDITWGSLEFAYSTNGTKTWDAGTHKFVVTPGTPAWTCAEGADKITLTNHSNTDISATLAYAETNSSGITGTFDKSKISLAAPAEGSLQTDAPTETAQLTMSGTLSESASKTEIGTVTVTVGEFIGDPVRGMYLESAASPDTSTGEFVTTTIQDVYTAVVTASASINPLTGYNASSAQVIIPGKGAYYVATDVKEDGTYGLSLESPSGWRAFSYYGTAVDRSYKLTLDIRDQANPTLTIKLQ